MAYPQRVSRDREPTEPGVTQPTQPADGDPVEIPVPERDDVMRDLRKMAKPAAEPSDKPRPYRRSRADR